ncbi:MAG: hypothetical protein WDZ40_00165 [Candidatus Spechtbacterales bacterium]
MNEPISIIKRRLFGKISHKEFVELASDFVNITGSRWESGTELEIVLYNKVPSFTTKILSPEDEKDYEENLESAVMLRLDSFEQLTPELFKKAAYVDLSARPKDEQNTSDDGVAYVSAKGLLPGLLRFQTISTTAVEAVESVKAKRGVKYKIGSGFERNYIMYWVFDPNSLIALNVALLNDKTTDVVLTGV